MQTSEPTFENNRLFALAKQFKEITEHPGEFKFAINAHREIEYGTWSLSDFVWERPEISLFKLYLIELLQNLVTVRHTTGFEISSTTKAVIGGGTIKVIW